MTELVKQITAQLLVIGRVRPNLVAIEAQSVAELFRLAVRRHPIAMELPSAGREDGKAPGARRRPRYAMPSLFALVQTIGVALVG